MSLLQGNVLVQYINARERMVKIEGTYCNPREQIVKIERTNYQFVRTDCTISYNDLVMAFLKISMSLQGFHRDKMSTQYLLFVV